MSLFKVLLMLATFVQYGFAFKFVNNLRNNGRLLSIKSSKGYSIPDQPKRFANAKADKNARFLDIDKFYKPGHFKNLNVLVTGGKHNREFCICNIYIILICTIFVTRNRKGNRGLGRAIVDALIAEGANVIVTSRTQNTIPGAQVIDGIEVTDDNCGSLLASKLNGKKIDVLINNAGYFYQPVEKIDSLNFKEEMKMIDICAVGPLRISSALFNAGLLNSGSKV